MVFYPLMEYVNIEFQINEAPGSVADGIGLIFILTTYGVPLGFTGYARFPLLRDQERDI